jgi:hypothetical protein
MVRVENFTDSLDGYASSEASHVVIRHQAK